MFCLTDSHWWQANKKPDFPVHLPSHGVCLWDHGSTCAFATWKRQMGMMSQLSTVSFDLAQKNTRENLPLQVETHWKIFTFLQLPPFAASRPIEMDSSTHNPKSFSAVFFAAKATYVSSSAFLHIRPHDDELTSIAILTIQRVANCHINLLLSTSVSCFTLLFNNLRITQIVWMFRHSDVGNAYGFCNFPKLSDSGEQQHSMKVPYPFSFNCLRVASLALRFHIWKDHGVQQDSRSNILRDDLKDGSTSPWFLNISSLSSTYFLPIFTGNIFKKCIPTYDISDSISPILSRNTGRSPVLVVFFWCNGILWACYHQPSVNQDLKKFLQETQTWYLESTRRIFHSIPYSLVWLCNPSWHAVQFGVRPNSTNLSKVIFSRRSEPLGLPFSTLEVYSSGSPSISFRSSSIREFVPKV